MDEAEITANTFAVEMLTGKPDTAYWVPRNLSAQELADWAQRASLRDTVDPGVVALSYAWNKGHWAVGLSALRIIEPNADAIAAVHARMCARAGLGPPSSGQPPLSVARYRSGRQGVICSPDTNVVFKLAGFDLLQEALSVLSVAPQDLFILQET